VSTEVWKYISDIDDEDIRMLQRDFITIADGMGYYDLSYKTFVKAAKRAGAFYHMGRRLVRINRRVLEAYLRTHEIRSKHYEFRKK